jgi:glycosyltransferase involved in cell wall biosynthesis
VVQTTVDGATTSRSLATAIRPTTTLARPARVVAATGSPIAVDVMSGLPHHLWRHGLAAGIIDGVVTRSVRERNLNWLSWNLRQAVLGRSIGGYRYTPQHLERMWMPLPEGPATVINCFQLYPEHIVADDELHRWYFIDQTLAQLFHEYRSEMRLSRAIERAALYRERRGYEAADHIVVNSEWARLDVVNRYGVEPEQVSVIHQAANFETDRYEAWVARRQATPLDQHDELRLVFVGVQWRRKGLDRLLRAIRIVNSPHSRVTLDVVGCNRHDLPANLADTVGVRWHGFVPKDSAEDRFLDLVGAADIGCLLSRAEAGGNCVREFHALGLALLGTAAGGSAEQAIPDASWIVSLDETVDDIAERLRWLCDHRDEVERAKTVAWEHRTATLWDNTLDELATTLDAHGA